MYFSSLYIFFHYKAILIERKEFISLTYFLTCSGPPPQCNIQDHDLVLTSLTDHLSSCSPLQGCDLILPNSFVKATCFPVAHSFFSFYFPTSDAHRLRPHPTLLITRCHVLLQDARPQALSSCRTFSQMSP